MNRFFASLVSLVIFLGSTGAALADQYAAIAFSQETGAIGYSYGCSCRAEAERVALKNCDADDADVVMWVKNGYLALALGDEPGSYGVAWASTRARAERIALNECAKNTTGGYIAQWVFSGN